MRALPFAAVLLAPAAAAAFPFGPLAPADDVATIVAEMDLPTVHPSAGAPLARVRYPAAALGDYAADVPLDVIRRKENPETYRLRRDVLAAFELMRDGWANDGRQFRPAVPADVTHLTKADIRREQDVLAGTVPRLELHQFQLEAHDPRREPRRWRAHFDYARAEVAWRLAVMHEYNELLGRVRTENLPPLDPAKHTGYRLRPTAEPAAARAKASLKEARERFAAVANDYPNTPWAVASLRALRQPPGLTWEAAR